MITHVDCATEQEVENTKKFISSIGVMDDNIYLIRNITTPNEMLEEKYKVSLLDLLMKCIHIGDWIMSHKAYRRNEMKELRENIAAKNKREEEKARERREEEKIRREEERANAKLEQEGRAREDRERLDKTYQERLMEEINQMKEEREKRRREDQERAEGQERRRQNEVQNNAAMIGAVGAIGSLLMRLL